MKIEEDFPITFDVAAPGARSRRGRRRRMRSRAVAIIVAMALAAAGAWAGATLLGGDKRTTEAEHARFAGAGSGQTAYLMMVRQSDDVTRRSDMLAVFAIGDDGRSPVTLLVPATALTEIPGHGLDLAGRAFSFGGMTLQSLVVDNMLGIALDRDLAMTDEVIGKMVDQVGGLDVDIEADLVADAGDGLLVPEFSAGRRHLDGEAVRRYLRFQAADETELSRLARAQNIWEGLIAEWGALGPGVLAQRFRALGREYGHGLESGLTALDLAEFFSAFAAAGAENRVYTTLPVTPVAAGGDEQALRIEEERVAELVRQYFAKSVPANPYRETRIEVLNGNGVPQIGGEVGLLLIPRGFRIVIDRNAPSFDYEQTTIIVYGRDETTLAAANRIRELLGVGEVQIGVRSQSVVDVTVIVGHDFQPRSR